MTKGPFEQTFRRRFKKATMAALAPNPRQLGWPLGKLAASRCWLRCAAPRARAPEFIISFNGEIIGKMHGCGENESWGRQLLVNYSCWKKTELAERVGFEPTVRLPLQRFDHYGERLTGCINCNRWVGAAVTAFSWTGGAGRCCTPKPTPRVTLCGFSSSQSSLFCSSRTC